MQYIENYLFSNYKKLLSQWKIYNDVGENYLEQKFNFNQNSISKMTHNYFTSPFCTICMPFLTFFFATYSRMSRARAFTFYHLKKPSLLVFFSTKFSTHFYMKKKMYKKTQITDIRKTVELTYPKRKAFTLPSLWQNKKYLKTHQGKRTPVEM